MGETKEAERSETSLHLYAPPYCVCMYDNPVLWTMAKGKRRKCFNRFGSFDVCSSNQQPYEKCPNLCKSQLKKFIETSIKSMSEKKFFFFPFNSLSPLPSIYNRPPLPSTFHNNLRRNHPFYTWEFAFYGGTELIEFVTLSSNLYNQKRNRMEIFPVVRVKIPTPTRQLTPTMIRQDWGLKENCNATVLHFRTIRSTAWRKNSSALIIQSKWNNLKFQRFLL